VSELDGKNLAGAAHFPEIALFAADAKGPTAPRLSTGVVAICSRSRALFRLTGCGAVP